MKIDFGKYLKDPMVLILTALLVFLTGGNAIRAMKGPKITIALDCAYGGEEAGYAGIVNEADVTAGVVKQLAEVLSQDDRFTVVLLQDGNKTKSVEERAAQAKEAGASIILSIHAEGSGNPNTRGQRNFMDEPDSSTHKTSRTLAEEISKAFGKESENVFTGYRYYQECEDGSYEIHDVGIDETLNGRTWQMMELSDPAVVISDICYVTNVDDVNQWAGEAGYQKAASLYYEAITAWYDTVK